MTSILLTWCPTFHSCDHRLRTHKLGCRLAWGLGDKPAGEPGGTAAWAPGDTVPLVLGGLLGGTVGEEPDGKPPWESALECFHMTGVGSAWGSGGIVA